MGHPGPFFVYFWSFSNEQHYNIYNKLMLKCPSSIHSCDLNPEPSVHEPPPITTRPGLPPNLNAHFNT